MERFCLTKRDVFRVNEDTWIVSFEETIDFLPGQFLMVETPKLVRKPFALGYWGGHLAISVQIKGMGTNWIVHESKRLKAHGPLGNGFVKPGKGVLLISPTCVTMAWAFKKFMDVDVIVGSRTPVLLNLGFETVVGDEAFLEKLREVSRKDYDWYLVAGSRSMEKVCWEELKGKREVYFSLEEYMACGIGACKSCAILTNFGVRHVCTDGPVFRGEDLCWS